MNYIKKIFSILVILVIVGDTTVSAGNTETNIIKCSGKEGFQLYKCEKKEICMGEEFGATTKKIIKLNKVYTIDTNFINAQKIYTHNQNLIYKCGILNSQEKAFKELAIKLVRYTDKTGILKTKITSRINQKINRIVQIKNQNKCKTVKQRGKRKKSIKKIVLDQSTLEYCDYKYFLKYLSYLENNDLSKSIPKNSGFNQFSSKEIGKIITENKKTISNEIKHIDKMYSIAFETYTQYDSFFKIHIILELLEEDYRNLRDKLYQTLHPINQVIYKIINAQSK